MRGGPSSALALVAARAAREDVGQPLHVGAGDDLLAALVLLAQAVDELGAQDVDLAVQDAPPVGDLGLLLGELLDESFSSWSESEPRSGNVSMVRGYSPYGQRRPSIPASARVKLSLRVAPSRGAAGGSAVADVDDRGHEREEEAEVEQDGRRASSARTRPKKSADMTARRDQRPHQLICSSTPRRSASAAGDEHEELARRRGRPAPSAAAARSASRRRRRRSTSRRSTTGSSSAPKRLYWPVTRAAMPSA